MKNIFYHLVTISIPKIAKNGEKEPILTNSEIRLLTYDLWTFVVTRLSQNAKVLKCCAPEAFSGAKFQVLMENSNKKWVGKG